MSILEKISNDLSMVREWYEPDKDEHVARFDVRIRTPELVGVDRMLDRLADAVHTAVFRVRTRAEGEALVRGYERRPRLTLGARVRARRGRA